MGFSQRLNVKALEARVKHMKETESRSQNRIAESSKEDLIIVNAGGL